MADVIEIEDTSPASVLPHEMLTRIFTFLPLTDRKNVRLVSRSWFNCSTCVNITKHEKFVFRTGSRIEDVTDVILRSMHSQLNLEFQSLSVSDLPAYLWKACSQRIRMLELYECRLNHKTIRNIILHCENLTSFHVQTSQVSHGGYYCTCEDIYSQRLLDELIKEGIQRPNLHTLSILTMQENIQDEDGGILSKISLIYPSIKHFGFSVSIGVADSFLNLDQCLNPNTPLESLTYDVLSFGEWMETFVSKAGHGLRLKHLKTSLFLTTSSKDAIFNFFKLQRNLESIRLDMKTNDDMAEIKVLLFHILESCPNLRDFRLNTYKWYLPLNYSEVPRFVTLISKLNFLSLDCKLSGSEHLPWFSELPTTNPVQLKLTTLKWNGFSYDNPDVCTAFLQRCSYLQHLFLTNDCCDTTLQIIFQYLPGLQTLVVRCIENCTDFGFTGRDVDGNDSGYSIKGLQQLKYLSLYDGSTVFKFKVTEKTALELQLPQLEFLSLRLRLFKQLSEETRNKLASNLPELRVLTIQCYEDEEHFTETTTHFCKQLKSLQRLTITISPFCDAGYAYDNMYTELSENLFSSCNCLRYMSWSGRWTFFREPFTGKVLRERRSFLKFPKNIFHLACALEVADANRRSPYCA